MEELNSAFLGNAGGSGAVGSCVGASSSAAVGMENNGGSGGGGDGDSCGVEERGSGGEGSNRWPSAETLALLEMRSEMELAFRDSKFKGPLWDEISRKLSVLGYNRSSGKCKEKFENLVKYHRKTKDGRSGRQNGKSYRFFEQLEKFDNQPSRPRPSANNNQPNMVETTSATQPMVMEPQSFVPPLPTQNLNMDNVTPSTPSTSSSGWEPEDSVSRKRKLEDFCNKLIKKTLEKQESLQNKLLEAFERHEREWIAREDKLRKQLLEKDVVVRALLQKIEAIHMQFPETAGPVPDKHIHKQPLQISTRLYDSIDNRDAAVENNINSSENVLDRATEKQHHVVGENFMQSTASRWPKTEVEALIRLRINLGVQYQDNILKGPLWEEISVAMKKLGYDRNGKRCKEKWDNINKYYKRVKESQKKRPKHSKTCPYIHLLDSIYDRKSDCPEQNAYWSGSNLNSQDISMEMMYCQQQPQQQQSLTEDVLREAFDHNQDEEAENEDGYQLVAIHPSSPSMN